MQPLTATPGANDAVPILERPAVKTLTIPPEPRQRWGTTPVQAVERYVGPDWPARYVDTQRPEHERQLAHRAATSTTRFY